MECRRSRAWSAHRGTKTPSAKKVAYAKHSMHFRWNMLSRLRVTDFYIKPLAVSRFHGSLHEAPRFLSLLLAVLSVPVLAQVTESAIYREWSSYGCLRSIIWEISLGLYSAADKISKSDKCYKNFSRFSYKSFFFTKMCSFTNKLRCFKYNFAAVPINFAISYLILSDFEIHW